MKINILIILIIAILLTSCAPGIPTQAIEVTKSVPTEASFTEAALTQAPVATEKPTATATETPTQVPSKTPPSCLELLTPTDGTELPAMGKVTFSWSPVNEAIFYALNIMPPSGQMISFETKQPIREQYMEAFPAGGNYQWKVVAEDRKRNEICSSELATFSKSSYKQPKQPGKDEKKKN